jgi:hypothetical protein
MKKIIFLLIIFFNILPAIRKQQLVLINVTGVFAQDYGEEESDCPPNATMYMVVSGWCYAIESTGSYGDEDCPYEETSRTGSYCGECLDCTSGGGGGGGGGADEPYETSYTAYVGCEICTITVIRHTNGDPDDEIGRNCVPNLNCGGSGGGGGGGGEQDFPYTTTYTEYENCSICTVTVLRHTNGDPDEELSRDCNYDPGCGGGGGDVFDCAGVMNGTAYYDACGQCVGGSTGQSPCVSGGVRDCAGVINGSAYIDQCGTCVAGSTGNVDCSNTMTDCAGVIQGSAYIDQCGSCVGGSTNNVDCDTYIPYTLTTEDLAIYAQLAQEDAEADALFDMPCKGTNRTGNRNFPGTKEHWIIMLDYVAKNPGFAEVEYYIPGSGPSGGKGYADIVNKLTGEIFEIKPNNPSGISAGTTEVNNYVTNANMQCNPAINKELPFPLWIPGSNYSLTILPSGTPGQVLKVQLGATGVIVYETMSSSTNPVVLPITQDALDKLKNLIRKIKQHINDADAVIAQFMREHPELVIVLKSAAVATAATIVVGTILEDIGTGGTGIADDWASFQLAYKIVRFAWKL